MTSASLLRNKTFRLPERVRFEKSFSNIDPDAWKNSQKSAVVGGGEGDGSKTKEHGD